MKIFTRFTVLLLCLVCCGNAFSQSTANYIFTTSSNGSLTDMTGSTQIVGAGLDDNSSAVQTIPFSFYLMGTAYTQFSANSNGFMSLGGTQIPTSQYTLGAGGIALISPFGSDEKTQTGGGGVFYLVTGSGPNRVLTVEFRNMIVIWDGAAPSGASNATFQVRLYETSAVVELVYGTVSRNSSTGFQGGMEPLYIGFSTGSGANNVATIKTAGVPTLSTTTPTSNQYTLGQPVAELTSSAQGSRVVYTFTPPVRIAPTNLNFTAITPASTTLNWTDNSSTELGYAIFKSTDGISYTAAGTVGTNVVTSVQSGLQQYTNYFWRVVTLTEGGASAPVEGQEMTAIATSVLSNGTGGLWSEGSTWMGGVPPTPIQNAIIGVGDNVTLNTSDSVLNLTVAGTLTFDASAARTLNVGASVIVSVEGILLAPASGSVTGHVLSIAGNLTNRGILDLSRGTAAVTLNFTNDINSSYTGTGVTNDLHSLTLTKSSRAQLVEINVSNFSVRGLSTAATGALLTSNTGTGTLKISGTNTFDGNIWSAAGYTIPSTLGFWLNNPNFTVNAQNGAPFVSGLFRVSAGTYNIGVVMGNTMAFFPGAVITVEGGSINVASRFCVSAASNIITYNQTGGTITVAMMGSASTTQASFDLGSSGANSTVNITGGTIIVQKGNTAASGPRDYRNQAGLGISGVTSGATLQLGNALSGGTPQAFNVAGVMPNIVLTNTSANHTGYMLPGSVYNNISRNVTISAGTTLNFGEVFLFAGSSIVNNGAILHNAAAARFITTEPNTNITYSGSGGVTGAMTSIELQNDLNFTIDPASSQIPVVSVTLFSGSFINANKLTIGDAGATVAKVQIGNSTTPTAGGSFDVTPAFNMGFRGQNLVVLRTTTPVDIGTAINPSRYVYYVTIDPGTGNTVNLSGGNIQINDLLVATGSFDLGGSTLTIGVNTSDWGRITGSASIINGTLKRWVITSTAGYNFPVGVSADTTDMAPKPPVRQSTERFYSPSVNGNAGTVGYMIEEESPKSKNLKYTKTSSENNNTALNKDGSGDSNTDAFTSYNRSVSINYSTAPTSGGTLTAEWISAPSGTLGLPYTYDGIEFTNTSSDGFWRITAADGLDGGVYGITCVAEGIIGVYDYTKLTLLSRSNAAASWVVLGSGPPTGSNSAPVFSKSFNFIPFSNGYFDFTAGGGFENPLPVELASFTSNINRNNVILNWSTVSEKNNSGFDVERKTINGSWVKIANIQGNGTSNVSHSYTFEDKNLATAKYNYRLKQIDYNGNYEYFNLSNEVMVGVPTKFELSQNYPNPFNPSTTINYELPSANFVSMKIYDITGREVMQLVNEVKDAGYYTVKFNASMLSSGMYFYKIQAGDFVSTKKMMLVK